jgi:hypothetical protein
VVPVCALLLWAESDPARRHRLLRRGQRRRDFDRAWLHHQHFNAHHWNHWVLRRDDGSFKALPMPERFAREMVADWIGAGRAQGKPDVRGWYEANRDKLLLDPATRSYVERLLDRL